MTQYANLILSLFDSIFDVLLEWYNLIEQRKSGFTAHTYKLWYGLRWNNEREFNWRLNEDLNYTLIQPGVSLSVY